MYVREVLCDHSAQKCFQEKWLGFFLKGGIKCLKMKQEIFGFLTGWIFFKSGFLKNGCSMFQAFALKTMIISLTNKKAESRSNRKLSGYPIKKCLLRRKFKKPKKELKTNQ